jgi:hypothetical protein
VRARVLASLPDSTERGANAGSFSSRAKLTFHGQTSWDTWRNTRIAIPLGTGSRGLAKTMA